MRNRIYKIAGRWLYLLILILAVSCTNSEESILSVNTTASISTDQITSINQNSFVVGGTIVNDGGSNIFAKGVCWNINTQPTIALNTKTIDGAGNDNFMSVVSGLQAGTTYYVRSYATNQSGTSYGNERICTTSTIAIGQNFQGGIIAYILKVGDNGFIFGQNHGLIVTSTDLSGMYTWGCPNILIGNTSALLGAGKTNTLSIVTKCSVNGIAARVCNDLTLNGYDDWFLPSKDELNKIFLNKNLIGNVGNGSSNSYLSSTEAFENNNFSVWGQNLQDGAQFNLAFKIDLYKIRAVRQF